MTRRIIVTALKISAALLLIAIIGLSIFLRIEQYRLRRKSEAIISDMRTLLTSDRSPARIDEFAKKWNFEVGQCSQDECFYGLILTNRTVDLIEHLDEERTYAWNRSLVNLTRVLGAPRTNMIFGMSTRNGVFDSGSVHVWLEVAKREEYPSLLVAEAILRNTEIGASESPSKVLASRMKHPDFFIEKNRGTTNSDNGGSHYAVYSLSAQFTPSAQPSDISRLMQFNLDCITRLRSCTEKDLMLTSWEQWEGDEQIPTTTPDCSPAVIERVASIADYSATFSIESLDQTAQSSRGPQRFEGAKVDSLIGRRSPRLRFHGVVDRYSNEPLRTADSDEPLKVGHKYIFLLQYHNYGPAHALFPCGILEVTPENRELAKRVGTP